MSNLNSKATVDLLINGKQAQETLNQLRQNALQLETAIAKAAASGNKTDLKRLRRELSSTKKQIREIETATQQVEHTLLRLDRATPRELNQALSTLNRQLNYLERGSDAWNAHVEKIKAVKRELKAVNDTLRDGESFWDRFNRKMNDWQTTIAAGAAAMTGLVMAGRKAVSAYADMDAEMANVRKYTGMTAEQVERMNEEFKKIDTRTSREDLNKLAQEAGRLGKTSQEDVLGFVRAADQINVALDELGEGATLTLSKLTNIFGDEERLGTEQALLSVGSVINELSQNCTASAPYLANFAQRMAGVGAQAKMTIPEIMGLAAVLDSQGQKVEMSSTAVSKVIMDMFKQQDQIIKATGLNAKKFKETVTRDTNEGLLMLLEQLHSLGNIDVLAPVFKDMGENGARAAQVISALAGNLEMIRWEQDEARKAFEAGISVTNEFEVQNNTVQAGLDKARKRINELAVELGQQLMPVMRHILSSTTIILKVMSSVINFVIKNKTEIAILTGVVAAYTVAVNLATIKTKALAVVHGLWNAAVKTMNLLLPIGRVLLTGMQQAYERLIWQTRGATAAQQAYSKSLTALKKSVMEAKTAYGLLAVALAAVVIGIVKYIQSQNTALQVSRMMNGIRKEAAQKIGEEKTKIDLLIKAAQNETLSLQERETAIKKLNAIIPNYNAHLDKTTGKYVASKKALDDYIASLTRMYEIEGAREKLKEIGKEKAEAQIELNSAKEGLKNANNAGAGYTYTTSWGSVGNTTQDLQSHAQSRVNRAQAKVDRITAKEKAITDAYGTDLQRQEATKEEPVVVVEEPSGNSPVVSGGSNTGKTDKSHEDKFKKEKEWKAREEALNRIAYATGQKDYEDYQLRILNIEEEYNEKLLSRQDLTEQERLEAQASVYESRLKQQQEYSKMSIAEENARYNEAVADEKQRYIDGQVDYETYSNALQLLELEHLRRMVQLQKEGSKERLGAEKAYQDKLLADRRKKQQEAEALEKKHQDALKKIKDEYFGDNPQERKAKYDADFALLQEVYNKELLAAGDNAKEKLRIEEAFQKAKLALMEKYNIEGADSNKSFLEKWNEDVIEFLDSDLGQAIYGSLETFQQSVSQVFQQLTSIVQAELEIQTAAINKRYDREISLAEGNNYKVKKLEKQREAEIAKAKNEANKKMFAMQVIQAIAQTASNAINAYGSAAAIPLVGHIIAPAAAAMAVAAGMLQVAAIKKQQQASEAQGYATGGFTPDGRVDEVAGVVHAGEWVASQKLVRNPKTRPILEALDKAQRTNTIGSLSAEDVSQTITAPSVIAKNITSGNAVPFQVTVQNQPDTSSSDRALADYADTMRLLRQRLDEPFLTVNSVTGDTGMKQAQDEYNKLMRNKTPKSRR